MSSVATGSEPSISKRSGAGFAELLSSRWTVAILLIFAIAQQCVGHQNTDNSWLFTVAERVLGGARPYVDIIETNPPASFLIYLPSAWLARLLGWPTEAVAAAFVFANAILCAWMFVAILRRADITANGEEGFVAVALCFTLLVLPALSFAEREHLAVIWILPILAIYAARSTGAALAWPLALAAGVSAAFVISIKPHFALPLLFAGIGVVVARRSLAPVLAIENIVAAMFVALYVAIVFRFFPAFFDTLSATIDAYVPLKQRFTTLLAAPWFLLHIALLAAAGVVGGRKCFAPPIFGLIAASFGFLVTFFLQGKGWVNHELPGVALACVALAMLFAPMVAAARSGAPSPDWLAVRPVALYAILPAVVCAPLLFGARADWTDAEEHEGLTAAVRQYAPPHPRLIALSPQLTAGHPLTRRLNGVWAGRTHSLLIMTCARMLIAAHRGDDAYRARLAGYATREAQDFLEDVRANTPDAIIVDKDKRIVDAIADMPALAAALADYAPVADVDEFTLWTRKR